VAAFRSLISALLLLYCVIIQTNSGIRIEWDCRVSHSVKKKIRYKGSGAMSVVLPELGLAQLSHGFGALGSKLSWVAMTLKLHQIAGSSDPLESRLLALGLLAPSLVVLVCTIHWWATRLVPGNDHRVIRQSPSAHQRLRSHNNLHRFFTGTTLHRICLK